MDIVNANMVLTTGLILLLPLPPLFSERYHYYHLGTLRVQTGLGSTFPAGQLVTFPGTSLLVPAGQ